MPMKITSYPEFDRAMHRMQELQGAPEGSPEHAELLSLESAVSSWEANDGNDLFEPIVWPDGPPQHYCSALTHGAPAVGR